MERPMSAYRPLTLQEVREFTAPNKRITACEEHFNVYSPEIVALIDEWAAAGNYPAGNYPYNRDIERLAQQRLFPEMEKVNMHASSGHPLSRIVYNSQCYRHARIKEEQREALRAQGFRNADNEELKGLAGRKFEVAIIGTNFLGFQRMQISTFTLKSAGKGELFWMPPKARSRGYRVSPDHFIREAPETNGKRQASWPRMLGRRAKTC